jgi:hypothetical protein
MGASEQHGGGPEESSRVDGGLGWGGRERVFMSIINAGDMSLVRKDRSVVAEVPRYSAKSACLLFKLSVSLLAAATVDARSSGSSR